MQPRFLLLLSTAAALLTRQHFENSVFGAPPFTSAPSPLALPPFNASLPASFLFTGTLSPPAAETLVFSALTSGALRLYVDDRLLLEDHAMGCRREAKPWLGWPALPSAAPAVPFRLEFTHRADCPAPLLQLFWEGNSTPRGALPDAALGPPPAEGPRAELAALRARLYEPLVPWQTLYAPHMGAHSLQPSGLLLSFSIGDARGGFLGNLKAFPSFQPAMVRPGGHSFNGSDWTALTVSRWGSRNATVSIFTTAATEAGSPCSGTQGAGAPRCNLAMIAACEGADCGSMFIVASLSYGWLGMGGAAAAPNGSMLLGTPAGFPPLAAFALTRPATPPLPPSTSFPNASILLPFSGRGDLPWPGGGSGVAIAALATGGSVPMSLADAIARVAAAQRRYEAGAARFSPTAAALYEPMRAVLAWNTIYTHYLHVYTPVSRNWESSPCVPPAHLRPTQMRPSPPPPPPHPAEMTLPLSFGTFYLLQSCSPRTQLTRAPQILLLQM